jgi:tRNA U38,U39,U40 pseudouridine synthase TruA
VAYYADASGSFGYTIRGVVEDSSPQNACSNASSPLAADPLGAEAWIEVEGNGFLYNMVRIIAGSLVMVGAGRRRPGWLADALAARSRPAAGPTAPPQGLVLVSINLAPDPPAPEHPPEPAALPCPSCPNDSAP